MSSRKAANDILQRTNKMYSEHSAPKELLVKYKDHEDSAQDMGRQKKGKTKQVTNEKGKGDSVSCPRLVLLVSCISG